MAVKLGLTAEELREIDTQLRHLDDARQFAERLHNTGVTDMTEDLVAVTQLTEGLQRLKSEFGPAARGD